MKPRMTLREQQAGQLTSALIRCTVALSLCAMFGCAQSGLLSSQESAPIESQGLETDTRSAPNIASPPKRKNIEESVVNISPLDDEGVGAPVPIAEEGIAAREQSTSSVENINKPIISSSATQQLLGDAQAAFVKGDLVAAESVTNRGLRIAPKDPALWLQLAKIRLGQGEYQEAVSLSERAHVLAANNPAAKVDALEIIATAYDSLGDVVKAAEARAKIRDVSGAIGIQ